MIHCLTPLKTQSINNQQADAILGNRRATNKSSSDKETIKKLSGVYTLQNSSLSNPPPPPLTRLPSVVESG